MRAAGAYASPALYEGFGIAPLEAMASGTPAVVAADSGGLVEVSGPAAIVVAERSAAAWREARRAGAGAAPGADRARAPPRRAVPLAEGGGRDQGGPRGGSRALRPSAERGSGSAASISSIRASQECEEAARERSARRSGLSAASSRSAASTSSVASPIDVDPLDPLQRRQRRAEDRQAGGEVLVDLHREDAAGEVVDRVGDQAGVGAPQDGREVGGVARPDQVDVRGARSRAVRSPPGSPAPLGPTRTMLHSRPQRRRIRQQAEVELGRDDRALEDEARARQGVERRVDRPRLERGREQLGVGDVRRVEDVARTGAASARRAPGRWRGRGRRAGRSAPPPP